MDSASILFSASASERCYMRSRRLSAAQPTVSMQASAIQACLNIAERSLSYAKIVQASAMKVYFQIAECSLSYAKIVQASAMKVYFQIAECSLSYAKIVKIVRNTSK